MKYDKSMEKRFRDDITGALKSVFRSDTEIPTHRNDGDPAVLREYLKRTYGKAMQGGTVSGVPKVNHYRFTVSSGLTIGFNEFLESGDNDLVLSWSQLTTFLRNNMDEIFSDMMNELYAANEDEDAPSERPTYIDLILSQNMYKELTAEDFLRQNDYCPCDFLDFPVDCAVPSMGDDECKTEFYDKNDLVRKCESCRNCWNTVCPKDAYFYYDSITAEKIRRSGERYKEIVEELERENIDSEDDDTTFDKEPLENLISGFDENKVKCPFWRSRNTLNYHEFGCVDFECSHKKQVYDCNDVDKLSAQLDMCCGGYEDCEKYRENASQLPDSLGHSRTVTDSHAEQDDYEGNTYIDTLLSREEYKGLTAEHLVVAAYCPSDFFAVNSACIIPDDFEGDPNEYCRKCWCGECAVAMLKGTDTKEDILDAYGEKMKIEIKAQLPQVPEFTAEIYDTSDPVIFEVKEKGKFKGVLIDIPIIANDDIRKRLADNGLSPKSEDETEIWFNTDKKNWNSFYIPNKYGNKGNMIRASEFLSDKEMETMRAVVNALPSSAPKSPAPAPAEIAVQLPDVPADNKPAVFDYSELDEATGTKLMLCEQVIRQQTAGYFTLLGEKLKEAQELLANHGKGTFEKWYTALGFKRQTVYNIIQRYEFSSSPTIGGHIEEFENLPLTLSYAISDPKAPAELVEKVLTGDIKSNAEYQRVLAELEEQQKKVSELEDEMREISDNAAAKDSEIFSLKQKSTGFELRWEQAEKSNKSLRESNEALQREIKELESRPIEVTAAPDEEALAEKDEEISRLRAENASLRKHEFRSIILKATMDQIVELMQLVEENFGKNSELYEAVSSARPFKFE